jgi:hypothetical protein
MNEDGRLSNASSPRLPFQKAGQVIGSRQPTGKLAINCRQANTGQRREQSREGAVKGRGAEEGLLCRANGPRSTPAIDPPQLGSVSCS